MTYSDEEIEELATYLEGAGLTNRGGTVIDVVTGADASHKAAAMLRQLLEERRWRKIEEAPKNGTAIWLWCEDAPYIGYYEPANPAFDETEGHWILQSSFERRDRRDGLPDRIFGTYVHDAKPTHWQPLPTPPQDGED